MILQAIYDHLKTISELTSIVGSDPCKIFYGVAPPKVKDSFGIDQKVKPPYIVYDMVGGEGFDHINGETGLASASFQFEFTETTSLKAELLFDTFRKNLNTANHTTWNTTRIESVQIDEPFDITVDGFTGLVQESPAFQSSVRIIYHRTIATP